MGKQQTYNEEFYQRLINRTPHRNIFEAINALDERKVMSWIQGDEPADQVEKQIEHLLCHALNKRLELPPDYRHLLSLVRDQYVGYESLYRYLQDVGVSEGPCVRLCFELGSLDNVPVDDVRSDVQRSYPDQWLGEMSEPAAEMLAEIIYETEFVSPVPSGISGEYPDKAWKQLIDLHLVEMVPGHGYYRPVETPFLLNNGLDLPEWADEDILE